VTVALRLGDANKYVSYLILRADCHLFLVFVHRVAVGVLPTFLRFVYFLPTDLPQAVTPHGSSVMVRVALLVQSLPVESVCNTLQRFDWPIN